ncbi:MAG TPA: hypothetical protein VMV37_08950 [Gammaproteobacteria bacterium]|nr:hypothetical protein [Gammaproteobacteria bacterium]
MRLAFYYAAIWSAYAALLHAFPSLDDAIVRERGRVVTKAAVDIANPNALATLAVPVTDPDVLALIALALIGAFLVAVPVSLTYQWTNDVENYRPDFGRAMVLLPIAVAMAVFIVKDSLALAFSLAGIAAVVRWRLALREAMDGVFMFVMIGIGLAAGVQLLVVALVASIVFNFTMLALHRNRFAHRPRRVDGWTLAAPAVVQPVPRRKVGLRIEASNAACVEERLAAVLPLCAKEWEEPRASPLPNGRVLLEYRITLKKKSSPDLLVSTISRLRIPEIVQVALTGEP